MAKQPIPASGGFVPFAVPVRDETVGFVPITVPVPTPIPSEPTPVVESTEEH